MQPSSDHTDLVIDRCANAFSTPSLIELEGDNVFGLPNDFDIDERIVNECAEIWAPHYLHKDGTLSPELVRIITDLNGTKQRSAEKRKQTNARRRNRKSRASDVKSSKFHQDDHSSLKSAEEMDEQQKSELVDQLVQLIKDQTKELEETKTTTQTSNDSVSLCDAAFKKDILSRCLECSVPDGWERIKTVDPLSIVYLSPSNELLTNIEAVQNYIARSGSCKCSLNCLMRIDEIFNFDPNVATRPSDNCKPLSCSCKRRRLLNEASSKPKRSRGRPRKGDRSSTIRQLQDTNQQTTLCNDPRLTEDGSAMYSILTLITNGDDQPIESKSNGISKRSESDYIPNGDILKFLNADSGLNGFAKHLIFNKPCDNKNSYNIDQIKTKNRNKRRTAADVADNKINGSETVSNPKTCDDLVSVSLSLPSLMNLMNDNRLLADSQHCDIINNFLLDNQESQNVMLVDNAEVDYRHNDQWPTDGASCQY